MRDINGRIYLAEVTAILTTDGRLLSMGETMTLINELKICYEEIDALQGKIDDAHEAMEKYSNEEIDNVCDAYEEVCMALD